VTRLAKSQTNASTVVILDFETTGLSPAQGDRAIEIGAVKLVEGQIVGRFQQLMNPGRRVSAFIESYTGITNHMLQNASPCREVMQDFAEFIEDFNLVAHNASFDARFLLAEFSHFGHHSQSEFACSMLIARRLFPHAPNHQLGTLVRYRSLPNEGIFHRALADAEMTAHLWLALLHEIDHQYALNDVEFGLMQQLSRTPKAQVARFLKQNSSVIN
jgi:DNA polymerase-3 subunit epsilon